MATNNLWRWMTGLGLAALLSATSGAQTTPPSDAQTSVVFEELWLDAPVMASTRQMELSLETPASMPADATLSLPLIMYASIPYEEVYIALRVLDAAGVQVHHASTETDLHWGRNEIAFQWTPADLTPGEYHLAISVKYADKLPAARCDIRCVRVSAQQWTTELAAAATALEDLEQHVGAISAETAPQARLRLRLLRDAEIAAREALAAQAWHDLETNLNYLRGGLVSLPATLAFSAGIPEWNTEVDRPSLESIEARDGGFYAGGRPVFLFGAALPRTTEQQGEQLRRMRRCGMNFAAAPLSLGADPETLRKVLDKTVGEALPDMALAVQLEQEELAARAMDQWPTLLDAGFLNLAHEGLRALYCDSVVQTAAALMGRPLIVGLSIADNPRFTYSGEPIRQHFVSRIKERYPDRIDLNRLWRSHLADYDEITIWGEHPDHSYQNRRAYQYEWQSFHQELSALFFTELKQTLSQAAPDVPIMLTLPNDAFSPGETRHGVNREAMADVMDISGCAAAMEGANQLYGMNYPRPHAYYALIRSLAPDKPILNLRADFDLPLDAAPQQRQALTTSMVWESVMSGVSGMALPADSALFDYPEAMDAFALAALDVNRLAPIVAAFQRDAPQIAILFSGASKIMDDGVPHLESARYAFEGGSFAGFSIRFVTEAQIERGALNDIRVLILPETLSVSDSTFEELARYVEEGGMVARVGTPIPYNERGHSRGDVIRATPNTVLVRGMNLPTEYLHAMDAALVGGILPEISRPINPSGYPIEGVRSRFVEFEGSRYLYIINLRNTPVTCCLAGLSDSGRDLIQGRDIAFPRILPPLEPMLLRMDNREMTISSDPVVVDAE